MAKAKSGKDVLKDIPLKLIRKTTNNVRKTRDKTAQDELVSSIRSMGLLQPIVVRPVPPDGEVIYEIAYGNNRYDAVEEIANFDLEKPIRAIVRNLSDDEAFIANIVENLQRQNVSEEDEAAAFAMFAEKYGEGAIEVLSDRIGSSQRYVRKRIMVMGLPKACLKAWKRGVIAYGHLEQLLRLQDRKVVLKALGELYQSRAKGYSLTVADLKQRIDNMAIPLEGAKFGTAECTGCVRNSATQLSLFGVGSKEAKCGDTKCFFEKQGAYLKANWKDSEFNIRHTNTIEFMFVRPEVTAYMPNYEAPFGRCLSCDSYASLVNADGSIDPYRGSRVCLGPQGCHAGLTAGAKVESKTTPATKDEQPQEGAPEKPRVDWHGEYFRQQFYRTEIPAVLDSMPRIERMKLALYNLLHSNWKIREWFVETYLQNYKMLVPRLLDLLDMLDGFSEAELQDITTKTLEALLFVDQSFTDTDRRHVAAHIKVDVGRWEITEEYLQKKVKAEILALIKDLGFMDDPAFMAAMSKKKMALYESLASLKKSELVDMILKSGADLNRVPREVLDTPPIRDWELRTPADSSEEEAGPDSDEQAA